MEFQITLISINTILLLILAYLLKSYLPTYFSEKAKLLAQKEDISAITREIEVVKSEYLKHVKLFESEQQMTIKKRSSLLENRDNTLFNLFEAVTDLIEEKLKDGFVFAAYDGYKSGSDDKYFAEVNRKFQDVRLYYYKIVILFPNDHALHHAAGQLCTLSLGLGEIFRSYYKQVAPCSAAQSVLLSAGDTEGFTEKIEEIKRIVESYQKDIDIAINDGKGQIQGYMAELNRYFNGADALLEFVRG
ncbi:MAG: hypothetical protein PHH28_07715 [Desulfuromonadaceae bacterium]|nr:hypothetical protein [Desulfuromonadaceae bacterium]